MSEVVLALTYGEAITAIVVIIGILMAVLNAVSDFLD